MNQCFKCSLICYVNIYIYIYCERYRLDLRHYFFEMRFHVPIRMNNPISMVWNIVSPD